MKLTNILNIARIASKIIRAIQQWQTEGYIEINDNWLERNNLRVIIARRDFNIVCLKED